MGVGSAAPVGSPGCCRQASGPAPAPAECCSTEGGASVGRDGALAAATAAGAVAAEPAGRDLNLPFEVWVQLAHGGCGLGSSVWAGETFTFICACARVRWPHSGQGLRIWCQVLVENGRKYAGSVLTDAALFVIVGDGGEWGGARCVRENVRHASLLACVLVLGSTVGWIGAPTVARARGEGGERGGREEREGGREEREGGREAGRETGREAGRQGGRQGGWEGGRE